MTKEHDSLKKEMMQYFHFSDKNFEYEIIFSCAVVILYYKREKCNDQQN